MPNLLRDALLEHGVAADQIAVIPDEQAAVDAALREAQPGDLVLIFGDAITRSWKQVIQFRPDAAGRPVERPARVSRPEPAGGAGGADGAGGPAPGVRARRARGSPAPRGG